MLMENILTAGVRWAVKIMNNSMCCASFLANCICFCHSALDNASIIKDGNMEIMILVGGILLGFILGVAVCTAILIHETKS